MASEPLIPKTFAERRAQWQKGEFEPGFEPFAESLMRHPTALEMENAGPCMISVFDNINRCYVFIGEGVEIVFKSSSAYFNDRAIEYFNRHLTPQDHLAFSTRALRLQVEAVETPAPKRKSLITTYLYPLQFPETGVHWILSQNAVLSLAKNNFPQYLFNVSAVANDIPNLQQLVEKQAENDANWVTPFSDITSEELHQCFNPTEAELLFQIAQGNGVLQVALNMGIALEEVMRILGCILKRSVSVSVVEILHKREWRNHKIANKPAW